MSADELGRLVARESAAAAAPTPALELPVVDLRTLLGEMTALKAEVRAETRAARDLRSAHEEASAALRDELHRAAVREQGHQRDLRATRRRAASGLIDIADRLEAALRSARAPVRRRWLWRDAPLDGFAEGLEITLERVAQHLADLGVTRIPVAGRFDPVEMEAVEVASRPDIPDGHVALEIVAGYRDDAGTLRPAQVQVNRQGGDR